MASYLASNSLSLCFAKARDAWQFRVALGCQGSMVEDLLSFEINECVCFCVFSWSLEGNTLLPSIFQVFSARSKGLEYDRLHNKGRGVTPKLFITYVNHMFENNAYIYAYIIGFQVPFGSL